MAHLSPTFLPLYSRPSDEEKGRILAEYVPSSGLVVVLPNNATGIMRHQNGDLFTRTGGSSTHATLLQLSDPLASGVACMLGISHSSFLGKRTTFTLAPIDDASTPLPPLCLNGYWTLYEASSMSDHVTLENKKDHTLIELHAIRTDGGIRLVSSSPHRADGQQGHTSDSNTRFLTRGGIASSAEIDQTQKNSLMFKTGSEDPSRMTVRLQLKPNYSALHFVAPSFIHVGNPDAVSLICDGRFEAKIPLKEIALVAHITAHMGSRDAQTGSPALALNEPAVLRTMDPSILLDVSPALDWLRACFTSGVLQPLPPGNDLEVPAIRIKVFSPWPWNLLRGGLADTRVPSTANMKLALMRGVLTAAPASLDILDALLQSTKDPDAVARLGCVIAGAATHSDAARQMAILLAHCPPDVNTHSTWLAQLALQALEVSNPDPVDPFKTAINRTAKLTLSLGKDEILRLAKQLAKIPTGSSGQDDPLLEFLLPLVTSYAAQDGHQNACQLWDQLVRQLLVDHFVKSSRVSLTASHRILKALAAIRSACPDLPLSPFSDSITPSYFMAQFWPWMIACFSLKDEAIGKMLGSVIGIPKVVLNHAWNMEFSCRDDHAQQVVEFLLSAHNAGCDITSVLLALPEQHRKIFITSASVECLVLMRLKKDDLFNSKADQENLTKRFLDPFPKAEQIPQILSLISDKMHYLHGLAYAAVKQPTPLLEIIGNIACVISEQGDLTEGYLQGCMTMLLAGAIHAWSNVQITPVHPFDPLQCCTMIETLATAGHCEKRDLLRDAIHGAGGLLSDKEHIHAMLRAVKMFSDALPDGPSPSIATSSHKHWNNRCFWGAAMFIASEQLPMFLAVFGHARCDPASFLSENLVTTLRDRPSLFAHDLITPSSRNTFLEMLKLHLDNGWKTAIGRLIPADLCTLAAYADPASPEFDGLVHRLILDAALTPETSENHTALRAALAGLTGDAFDRLRVRIKLITRDSFSLALPKLPSSFGPDVVTMVQFAKSWLSPTDFGMCQTHLALRLMVGLGYNLLYTQRCTALAALGLSNLSELPEAAHAMVVKSLDGKNINQAAEIVIGSKLTSSFNQWLAVLLPTALGSKRNFGGIDLRWICALCADEQAPEALCEMLAQSVISGEWLKDHVAWALLGESLQGPNAYWFGNRFRYLSDTLLSNFKVHCVSGGSVELSAAGVIDILQTQLSTEAADTLDEIYDEALLGSVPRPKRGDNMQDLLRRIEAIYAVRTRHCRKDATACEIIHLSTFFVAFGGKVNHLHTLFVKEIKPEWVVDDQLICPITCEPTNKLVRLSDCGRLEGQARREVEPFSPNSAAEVIIRSATIIGCPFHSSIDCAAAFPSPMALNELLRALNSADLATNQQKLLAVMRRVVRQTIQSSPAVAQLCAETEGCIGGRIAFDKPCFCCNQLGQGPGRKIAMAEFGHRLESLGPWPAKNREGAVRSGFYTGLPTLKDEKCQHMRGLAGEKEWQFSQGVYDGQSNYNGFEQRYLPRIGLQLEQWYNDFFSYDPPYDRYGNLSQTWTHLPQDEIAARVQSIYAQRDVLFATAYPERAKRGVAPVAYRALLLRYLAETPTDGTSARQALILHANDDTAWIRPPAQGKPWDVHLLLPLDEGARRIEKQQLAATDPRVQFVGYAAYALTEQFEIWLAEHGHGDPSVLQ